MKTSVRFLSMLLAVLMVAGVAITSSASDSANPGLSQTESVELLVGLGVIAGYEDGSLKLDQKVTRAEAAKMTYVVSTAFTDAGAGNVIFSDVSEKHWASGYISYLANRNVIGGYGDGTFGPSDTVTYYQMLKLTVGALGYTITDTMNWETEVRTLARDLDIGQDLKNLAGNTELTRGQTAQIIADALFAPMKETKRVDAPITDSVIVPMDVSMVLAEDIWKFTTKDAIVVAISGFGMATPVADEDKDIGIDIITENGPDYEEFTFEELGLSSYANDPSDLILANLKIFYNSDDEILKVATTIRAEEATVTIDEKNQKFYINGVEVIEYDSVEDNTDEATLLLEYNTTCFAPNGYMSYTDAEKMAKFPMDIVAYNLDNDDEYEHIVAYEYLPIEIKSCTAKKVSYSVLGETGVNTVDAEDFATTPNFAEDDIVIICEKAGKIYTVKKVEPIVAAAQKYSSKQITLDNVAYTINEQVFADIATYTVKPSVMDLDENGEAVQNVYYVYDGKVFHGEAVVNNEELNLGVLVYINEPEEEKFNSDTMDKTTSYTALVNIDGKNKQIKLNATDAINGLSFETDEEQILADYGKKFTPDGKYVDYNYLPIKYTVDKDGYYSLKTVHQSYDNYKVYEDHTISYDEESGLFTIKDGDTIINKKVLLDPTAIFYYTYLTETTGDHVHLGSYTASTLPADFVSVKTDGPLYTVTDEETGLEYILFAMFDDADVETSAATSDYRTDGRLVRYAYYKCERTLGKDGKTVYYEHYFANPFTAANMNATLNERLPAESATDTATRTLYTWNEETGDYVLLSSTNCGEGKDITCVNAYLLTDVLNGCIFTESGTKYASGIKIPESAVIWGFSAYGAYAAYSKLTLTDLAEMVALAEDYEAEVRILVITYPDDNGEEVIGSIYVDRIEYVESTDTVREYQYNISGFGF